MSANVSFSYSGDGAKTCKCCGRKIIQKGGIYEGVCSLKCSSRILEYNAIPINILFVKRIFLHINDEAIRNSEIDKYIVKNNFNQEMARDKIAKVSKFILSNNLDKLNVKSNTVFYINNCGV
jgi:hypothetical protein